VDDGLLTRVVGCVRDLPRRALAELVAEMAITPDWGQGLVSTQLVHNAAWADLRRDAIRRGMAPGRVADLLLGAMAMEARGSGRNDCEVAWTGPTPPLSSLRRTEQALLEVLASARRELWLVSFAAYRVASVQEALVAAAARGCRVRLLLESEEESGGKLSSGGIDSVPEDVARCCELYMWPREKRVVDERGRFGTLHAKCAVADGELLFVGSANLTEFAFELNLELGVLVRDGEAAKVVEEQLRWLLGTGILQRV
jgi:phosphatidylserine/phosphatidylglycerophosphate/cardiolipin synthase-like enzyme